ncbi:MAG: DUF262 domain-containing protein [Balneolaceae bacterium]|nr:DUF262 domain-containing protein [Balneolaceae bacterium]
MKNVEKPSRIHLSKLISNLREGNYVIPDFQREFEWKPWDVLDLIRSIFSDYYIGTLLLWEGNEKHFKTLSCESIYGYKGEPNPEYVVLDGQQRLTALHYVFFGPDINFRNRANRYLFFVNIPELLDENFEEAFFYSYYKKHERLLENPEEQFDQHVYPLSFFSKKGYDRYRWFDQYEKYWVNKASEIEKEDPTNTEVINEYRNYSKRGNELRDYFEELLNEYYVSFIELGENIELAKVCDIFTQINSKGVRLDIFDLLNAILRPQEIYLKDRWKSVKPRLSFADPGKMKIYILQVMSILEQAYCLPKYLYYLVPEAEKTIRNPDGSKETKILIDDKDEFVSKWDSAVKYIESAIKNLKNPRDFGAILSSYLPYPSILPAFAAIKAYISSDEVSNKLDALKKLRKWYWASIFLNRYSSSVESTSAKDFQDLRDWFQNDNDEPEYVSEFIRDYKNIDLLSEVKKGSAIYKAIFNVLIINGAKDWQTFELPEYDSLDDHHIIPSSLFRDEVGGKINSILNRTPLSPNTNRNLINNRMPNEYLKEMIQKNGEKEFYDVLESHLISKKAAKILLRDPFTANDFDQYIEERRKSIMDAIENVCIREMTKITPALKDLDNKIEQIELGLRNLISSVYRRNGKKLKEFLPGHLINKIDIRVNKELKSNPHLKEDDFEQIEDQIQFLDFSDYFDITATKSNWSSFESIFGNKQELQNRIRKLSDLRNRIRHSRDINETDKLDGQASITWFKNIFNSL